MNDPAKVKAIEELVRDLYAAFGARDVPALSRVFAEKVSWEVPGRSPLSRTYVGVDDVLAYFAALRERSGGTFKAQVVDVMAGESHAAVLAHATGAREGRAYDARYVLLLDVVDRRIARARLFNEDQGAFEAFWA